MKKKNSPIAQTTADALFGPIFVAAAPPIAYFVDYHYICYKLLVSKKEEMKKKTHLWPKQHIWHCLGPFLLSPPLPSCVS